MGMSMSMIPLQELSLRQIQAQRGIELSQLLSVPDEVMNFVIGSVLHNPDKVEGVLERRRLEKTEEKPHPPTTGEKVQTIYSSSDPSEDTGRVSRGGLIISPDLKLLEGCLGPYRAVSTPDVTYIGRPQQKPEIVFSDHLKGVMAMEILQIDASLHPETAKLISQLRKFDDWKRRTLTKAYRVIGDEQREFFEDLISTRFHIFSQADLAEKIGIHYSNVSRILASRWVEARNTDGEQKTIYTKDLLPTRDMLTKYLAIPGLNKALQEEFETGVAFSDQHITEMVSGLARRTIAKYRQEAGIPAKLGRAKMYQRGELEAPFQISAFD